MKEADRKSNLLDADKYSICISFSFDSIVPVFKNFFIISFRNFVKLEK